MTTIETERSLVVTQQLSGAPSRTCLVMIVRAEADRNGYLLDYPLVSFGAAADAIEHDKMTSGRPFNDARMVKILRLAAIRWGQIVMAV